MMLIIEQCTMELKGSEKEIEKITTELKNNLSVELFDNENFTGRLGIPV